MTYPSEKYESMGRVIPYMVNDDGYPMVFYIDMENGPSIDGLPIKNGDFPWLC